MVMMMGEFAFELIRIEEPVDRIPETQESREDGSDAEDGEEKQSEELGGAEGDGDGGKRRRRRDIIYIESQRERERERGSNPWEDLINLAYLLQLATLVSPLILPNYPEHDDHLPYINYCHPWYIIEIRQMTLNP
jgi:hypothetical protein